MPAVHTAVRRRKKVVYPLRLCRVEDRRHESLHRLSKSQQALTEALTNGHTYATALAQQVSVVVGKGGCLSSI